MGADGCGWMRVDAGGCGWMRVEDEDEDEEGSCASLKDCWSMIMGTDGTDPASAVHHVSA